MNIARRWFLSQCPIGVGALAVRDLFAQSVDPTAPKQPPMPAKAQRVACPCTPGPPSHPELFDYKPQLAKVDGTLPPPELLKGYRAAFINPNSKLLGPKFKFKRYGKSGTEMGELLPFTGEIVDE